MKYAINLADDGRVLSATFERYATESMVPVDHLPEGNIVEYRFVDGEYVHDPIPNTEHESETVPTLEDRVGTLETDTADLAEALNMILNGVVE